MPKEFDNKWKEVVERSSISDNGWLQSIYDIRASWVLAYCNHIFSAGMSSSQRAESCHSFFKKFQLMREDDNQRVYMVKKRSDQIQKDRKIAYDKHTDLASCTCKKFESEGIPCRHILGYLLKVQEVDQLPAQYISNRWTKVANVDVVKDLDGLEIIDTNALVVKRSKLFHHASLVSGKVLTSPDEAQTIFIEALDNVLDKLKQMQASSSESARIGKKLPTDLQHRYNEPTEVKAKGSGKRLKKTKEQAKRKRSTTRKCHECGLYGQSHDKRICPTLSIDKESSLLDKSKDEELGSFDEEDSSSYDEDDEN
ncbi:PREDICTED: protein FAR-RED ELONGATED HYPOCOTYL 3-like [Fragaria vesca subsp. vesca]|uniref:protein FAR-RED ELONGATED HYPOCOTYL 3-like n=1 Tax=Fragaria vesca subsp. vesca TaxID=101020 RepID=UPI0002C32CB9|nr:PREDICTED: protein FAR-RED ELONGATED HYPOCOTYL 3-like [Fragaria vesca subsp. vesca]